MVGGELFTDYSDHPRKLVTLNPKLKSTGAGRYQLLSRWWDAYRKQLGLKDFSPKTRGAGGFAEFRGGGPFPFFCWGVPPRAPTVAAISGLHCRALVMVSSSIRLTA
ncbi:glycoside hydrolase family protein [Streptomyces sp. PU10]|nr:glycoside hydrolase family protein [Streptomyces sp. PU10]MDU0258498.1 glycoside hydrolase family protein [Streptomyces sp. PU10]